MLIRCLMLKMRMKFNTNRYGRTCMCKVAGGIGMYDVRTALEVVHFRERAKCASTIKCAGWTHDYHQGSFKNAFQRTGFI